MARRKHSGEVNIGSDSFLDVIANIVGILIILIVIAGVRVSRAPVVKKQIRTEETEVAAAPELAPPTPVQMAPQEPEEPEEPAFAESTTPSNEVRLRMDDVRSELDSLEAQLTASLAEKQDLEARQARGELQVAAGRQTVTRNGAAREKRTKGIQELEALLTAQQNSLKLLESQLDEQKKIAPKVKTLKHRVTPISRVVLGDQLHFRLSGNKVSVVPIQDLLKAAMRQARRHVEDLADRRVHIGTAGPQNGYLVQYKLEAFAPSTSEVRQHGQGLVRVALTSFEIQPDEDLKEETADDALTRGSAFDLAMQTAEPGSTFTLWVYPDSFNLYRQLQGRLHDSGFTVAARPLPSGIPIAGSPEGTASAAQ